jgi:hypothetical protein
MKSPSVAQYLSDFSAPQAPPEPVFGAEIEEPALEDRSDEGFGGFEADVEVPVLVGEVPDEDPFEVGRLAGREEIQAELEQERERLEQEKREAIASAEEDLGAKLAGDLAARLDAALEAASGDLSATLARLIVPLAGRRIERKTLDAFAEKVSRLATEAQAASIEVQGPPALIAALRRHDRFQADGFRFVEADASEVTARIDDRLFETRLAPLLKELEEILA